MSNRPSLPKPIPRWPFILGNISFLLLALITLIFASTPPGLGSIILATVCVMVGVGLLMAPYLLEYDSRVRFAEAQAKEYASLQIRRVGQMTEQLANVVSRSQSTEEQVGQALGTLEEIADKLGAQVDDISQVLAKSRGTPVDDEADTQLQESVLRTEERMEGLEGQLAGIVNGLTQARTAGKAARDNTTKTLESINAQLGTIATRLEKVELDRPPPPPAQPKVESAPAPEKKQTEKPQPKNVPPPPEPTQEKDSEVEEAEEAADEEPGPKPKPELTPAPAKTAKKKPPESKPRKKSVPRKATAEAMELPFDGPSADKAQRRDSGPATSLVATAYIGIGNKLYLRGEGPGLNWDEGVPMQFLAIGKWGWTATDVDGQAVCRIYRNDETPMLDEDIIVTAGGKIEVTPRF